MVKASGLLKLLTLKVYKNPGNSWANPRFSWRMTVKWRICGVPA